jgi:ATP-dependent DNA helicase RecG
MYQKITEQEIREWIKKPENYNLEFKEAKTKFSHSEIYKYCSALSNEGGGYLIFGIVDTTREIVWSKAFDWTYTSLPNDIAVNLGGIRVDIDEIYLDSKRILIFRIPSRPTGRVIKYDKIAWVRFGESCRDMPEEQYRSILDEIQIDETQKIIPWITLDAIDPIAMNRLKELWAQETWKVWYLQFDALKTLMSLGLAENENNISLAGILLVWTEQSLRKYTPQSEIILEWRNDTNKTNYDFRTEIRKPFVLAIEDIWATINARNIRFPFQEGFIQRQVWAYNEKSVREAVINAFVHRDYRLQGGSIYILFSPEGMIVESPGGLVGGVTVENILYKKYARNRLLAEACVMIDLMEKSGQWIDDIFRESIVSGKWQPTIWEDGHEVRIQLPANLEDPEFVKFIERIENEKQDILPFEAILEMEHIRTTWTVSHPEYKEKLISLWLIEHIWHGRGTRYILSRKYYQESWKSVEFTRLVGLDRDLKKEYILKYIEQHGQGGKSDFISLLKDSSDVDIQNFLQELRKEWKIEFYGSKRSWFWKKVNI